MLSDLDYHNQPLSCHIRTHHKSLLEIEAHTIRDNLSQLTRTHSSHQNNSRQITQESLLQKQLEENIYKIFDHHYLQRSVLIPQYTYIKNRINANCQHIDNRQL